MKPDPRVPAAQFYAAGLDPSRFVRSDHKSVRGPCWCGGRRRLAVWLVKLNYQCDICGAKGFLVNDKLSPDAIAKLKAKAQAAALERERRIEQARSEFSAAELWEAFHRRLGDEQRAWWRSQGIGDDWQDFYHLGYVADKTFGGPTGPFQSAAFTMPIFELGWRGDYAEHAINMQYRLAAPPQNVGKYRQEAGLPAAAFFSRPEQPLGDSVVVVEGAKKAAVLCAHLPKSPQVIGLPGARSWAGMDERLAGCGRVWVMLDPDARASGWQLAAAIGSNARVVEFPAKPDDAILGGAGPDDFRRAFRYARRLNG